jgi:hypothetical protein
MNKLFKDGDYVLLSDCEAYDKEHGLDPESTMWNVARKMAGGELDKNYMRCVGNDDCVGIYGVTVGLFESYEFINQLTVDEVLNRDESHLAIDDRELVIKKATEILNKTFGIDTAHESICEKLYDAGVLR